MTVEEFRTKVEYAREHQHGPRAKGLLPYMLAVLDAYEAVCKDQGLDPDDMGWPEDWEKK